MQKFLNTVSKPKPAILILFFTTLLSYGQTLWMYFWIDDNALIYRLEHLNQNVGFFGRGIVGEGPYRHMVDQFVPFFPLFKTNPTPYFAIGILLYFLAAVSVYFFVNAITRNKCLALFSSLIFSSGYIGSDSIFGITNSWQTTRGIAMSLFCLWLFFKYKKTWKLTFYLSSVVMFFLSLDTVYVRAPGLIFIIFFFDLLFWPPSLTFRQVFSFVLRQIPFWYIHYYIYLSSLAYAKGFGILNILQEVFSNDKTYLLSYPFEDLGNVFIPDEFTKHIDNFVSTHFFQVSDYSIGAFMSGLLFIFILVYLTLKNFKKEKKLVLVLVFSSVWVISNFFVFYLREPGHTLWSTHRYLTYSFVGVALFWSTAVYLVFKEKKNFFVLSLGLVSLTYLLFNVKAEYDINVKRSIPQRKLFADFQKAVPSIPKNAIIYFNIANDVKIKNEFGSFFGGALSEGANFAIYTPSIDYTNEFLFTYDFDQIIKNIQNGTNKLSDLYTFYYGQKGLVDTTTESRELLSSGKSVFISPDILASTRVKSEGGQYIGTNPDVQIVLGDKTPSLVPSTFRFEAKFSPQQIGFPYKNASLLPSDKSDPELRSNTLNYLAFRSLYLKNSKIISGSYWKEQVPELALDGRLDTAWRGHRGYWDEIYRKHTQDIEHIQVDLGKIENIGAVVWYTAQKPLVPTHYRILVSPDAQNWKKVLEVEDKTPKDSGTRIQNNFPSENARYLKMEIPDTYGNDGPEIKEFEVIESRFSNLNFGKVDKIAENPFSEISSLSEYKNALNFAKLNSKARIYYMSDADSNQDLDKYVDVPVFIDGKYHEYQVELPAEGMNWKSVTLANLNFPMDIVLKNINFEYKK